MIAADQLELEGAYLLKPSLHVDRRGSFSRLYCRGELEKYGLNKALSQMNHSVNSVSGTLRGLHYQKPPHSEIKIIRCIRGSVFDVIVDLRCDSTTFLKSYSVILSASNGLQLLVPEGFAHGFQTLEDNSELLYMHSEPFSQDSEDGLAFDDPCLSIDWPLAVQAISDRDRSFSLLEREYSGLKL